MQICFPTGNTHTRGLSLVEPTSLSCGRNTAENSSAVWAAHAGWVEKTVLDGGLFLVFCLFKESKLG